MTGHLEENNRERSIWTVNPADTPGQSSLTGLRGQNGQNMTGRTGLLGQDNWDRIAIRG
jgi:hypothetical protein